MRKIKNQNIDYRFVKPDNPVRIVYQLVKTTFDQNRNPILTQDIFQDITEKKELRKAIESHQDELDRIQKRFELLVQETSDVIEIISPDGTLLYISESCEKVIGYKPEERIGKKIYEYYEKSEQQKLARLIDRVLSNPDQTAQGEISLVTKEKKRIYIEIQLHNLLHEPTIQGIAVSFRDITPRIKLKKEIKFIYTHDDLTGLPNCRYFKDYLQERCRQPSKNRSASFAVFMLDIDNFKYINDALGNTSGDQLIIQTTERLKTYLGEKQLFCRYSGDQFGIVIENSGQGAYKNIAKDILSLFSEPFKIDLYELDVTASIGISIYLKDAPDMDSLINNANIALLRAKNEGKNRYQFYRSDINIQSYKEFQLRNDLRKAIENNEFKLYFQPLINLPDNEIIAAEALLRWDHPDWGMLSPVEFISIAEESGNIIKLSNWVLREVCRNYKQWLENTLPPIKVAVNYTSRQFFQNNFVENILNTIKEFALDPSFLIIEITEEILINQTEKVISDIRALQFFGIQIALDDFGTGYSSLSYLNALNIDIIKIDSSFIKKIDSDESSATITKYIIKMAKDLNIQIVAEGIENWEQLSFLKQLNCDIAQGYIYSQPVPLKDFEEILARRICKPQIKNNPGIPPRGNRRKYFRLDFFQMLEANLTIKEIKGKKLNVGNTKVLVQNIGPGGLCFIANIKIPVDKHIILQFTMQLMGREIILTGYSVWLAEEINDYIYKYGVEFIIDEKDRDPLISLLNQVQIKMRKNILFADGSFTPASPLVYFKSLC